MNKKGNPERNRANILNGKKKNQLRFIIISNIKVATVAISKIGIIELIQNTK